MNHRIPCFLATVLLIVCVETTQTHAQMLTSGTRVRVTSGSDRIVGTVDQSRPDSLRMGLKAGYHPTLAWSDVDRIEYSTGVRGRPGRGALIGAGVMTALTVGAIVFDDTEDNGGEDIEGLLRVMTLPISAAVGAGLGALVGLAWRTERWAVLPFRHLSGTGSTTGLTANIRL